MTQAMRVTHTAGPWTIEEYGDDDAPALVIHKDTETRICFMATPGSKGDPERIEANARLIAAAPDLLEACKAALREMNARIDFATANREAVPVFIGIADLHAAIAKAEGREP